VTAIIIPAVAEFSRLPNVREYNTNTPGGGSIDPEQDYRPGGQANECGTAERFRKFSAPLFYVRQDSGVLPNGELVWEKDSREV
jgi:hypothetical protein